MSDTFEEKTYPVKQSATFAGSAFVTMALIDWLANLGPTGLLISGVAGYVAWKHGPELYEQARGMLPLPALSPVADQGRPTQQETQQDDKKGRSFWDRALGIYPEREEEDQALGTESENDEDAALFSLPEASETNGVARLSIEQIVKHCEPNSYRVFIGRSLTQPGNPAVAIKFYKQHFRFMGASQRGKSSMVAAFLEIVTRTHDPRHVRIALLDLEDQTSKLFAHLPHVATIPRNGESIRLHARNADEVLERLINVVEIMQYRYEKLTKEQVLAQPIILVYVEEFLALKNEFKSRVDRARSKGQEAREKAQSDYATLVYCIEALAQRGLKARVQLLLSAQVEYADDDFKEAMASIGCGFSFCVRPTAAAAAGFRNRVLLKRNAEDNKVGQAVVETPDCNDLVLAPDFDLEARLIAYERSEVRTSNVRLLRPDVEPLQQDRNARTVQAIESLLERETEAEMPLRYVRNNGAENASQETVRVSESDVTPPDWDQDKIKMLPGFYAGFNSLDRALVALQLSTSQKNRDFARSILKQQGLWKEAR